MPKFMTVTIRDNSVCKIPTDVIARHRAAYYAKEYGKTLEESPEQCTQPFFNNTLMRLRIEPKTT